MSVTTRYFSTAAAGDGTGSSWANRAQLINAGTWSAVITGFDFTSDSLLCYIGPGTHTVTAAMAVGLFSVMTPSAACPIVFHGCDSSGNPLTPADGNWTSDAPAWSDSGLPRLDCTTDISHTSLAPAFWRLIKFTSSGRTGGAVISGGSGFDWCSFVNSTDNAATYIFASITGKVTNCLLSMTGANYAEAVYSVLVQDQYINCKLTGVAGTGGNRDGFVYSNLGNLILNRCCITGFGGIGVRVTSTSTSQQLNVIRCTIANNGSHGIQCNSTAAQTLYETFIGNCITGNGGYGLDTQGAGRAWIAHNRFRDNSSGAVGSLGNYSNLDAYTTDTDDATEYVDVAGGDFRINNGVPTFGLGYGVGGKAAVTLPATTDVRDGVGDGLNGNEYLGICVVPAAVDVLEGVSVDTAVGTYHAPSPAEVIDTAVYGPASATAGTYHEATAAEVQAGVLFGPASAYTGTYIYDYEPDHGDDPVGTIRFATNQTENANFAL